VKPLSPRWRTPGSAAFSLVEMLVSVAILSLLVVVLTTITEQTGTAWRQTSGKIEQFRSARDAFDSITRRLSQATLNTYWDYDNAANPTRYVRQSELRFLSGPMDAIAGTPPGGKAWPTHGMFFQAPVGFSVPPASGAPNPTGLENLLNTWGYFVEFGDDNASRPPFPTLPARYRYRLYEFMEPANDLKLYNLTSGNFAYNGKDWFLPSLKANSRPVHALADNVIALVIVPKLSAQEDQTATRLAPDLLYDSTKTKTAADINPKNQLPPVVQVTMVAIDENSAARLANGSSIPDLGLGTKFVTSPTAAAKVEDDLKNLQDYLVSRKINFRVFTESVILRTARWSTEQSD
jgi:uncharacterized protein (TIGR02599 family)